MHGYEAATVDSLKPLMYIHTGLVDCGVQSYRCRENVAHVRQSRPDSGLGFQVKVLNTF